MAAIDPSKLFSDFKSFLMNGVQVGDLSAVLKLYDNKGLLSRAATNLGLKTKYDLVEKVGKLLGDDRGKAVSDELAKVLPAISV